MTTSAHASRRVYSGATRTPARPPSVTSTFFDELHPHLRNVEAIVVQGADAIYQYLLRRAPRTTLLVPAPAVAISIKPIVKPNRNSFVLTAVSLDLQITSRRQISVAGRP